MSKRTTLYYPLGPFVIAIFIIYLIFSSLLSTDLEHTIEAIILFLLVAAVYYINKWKDIIFYGQPSNKEKVSEKPSLRRRKKKRISKDEFLFTPAKEKKSTVVMVSSVSSEEHKEPKPKVIVKDGFIWVPELGRQVRTCCYQSARIGDRYCVCGRVVDDDLLAIFHTEK